MFKKALLCAAVAGAMVLSVSAVNAATLTTSDGVLSIETPSDAWAQSQDPNYWFVITDGSNTITIDHLSNGQTLPAVQVANTATPAVYQAFVSTKNEVFVVKGLASTQEGLESLMQTISTIKVLKTDTKTAIQGTPAPQVSDFGLRSINATYYVTCDELRVRSGCSTDEAIVGTLNLGDSVTVIGAVQKNGQDYGWYQIQFNGGTAYASSGFLSTVKPSGSSSSSDSKSSSTGNTIAVTDRYGYSVGSLTLRSDGYYYASDGTAYKSNGDGSYTPINGGDTIFDDSYLKNLQAKETNIPVTDRYGYSVGTLTLHDDGYYYDSNGVAYSAQGDGSYEPLNGGSYVFDSTYLENLEKKESEDIYALASGFSVKDAYGSLQGLLVPYSDGLYYSNDMQPYVDNGDGSYTGINTGDTLYELYSYESDIYNADLDDYYDTDEATTVYNAYGDSVEIYPANDGSGFYVDEDGDYYMPDENGSWHTSVDDDLDVVYY